MASSHSLFSELENLRLKNGPCLLEGGPPVLCGSALLPALALLCPRTPHRVPPLPSVPSTSSSPQSPSDLKLTVTALPPTHTSSELWGHFSDFPVSVMYSQLSSPLESPGSMTTRIKSPKPPGLAFPFHFYHSHLLSGPQNCSAGFLRSSRLTSQTAEGKPNAQLSYLKDLSSFFSLLCQKLPPGSSFVDQE